MTYASRFVGSRFVPPLHHERLITQMVPIYSGKMLKTFYNVNVWHKHDAWNEYG